MTTPDSNGTLPDALDTSKPNVARAYDYLLGGKDNFAADRELAGNFWPSTREPGRWSRKTGGS